LPRPTPWYEAKISPHPHPTTFAGPGKIAIATYKALTKPIHYHHEGGFTTF